jgi:hypothetical protein
MLREIAAHVYANDDTLREFTNGIWWLVGLCMIAATVWRLGSRIRAVWTALGRRECLGQRVALLYQTVRSTTVLLLLIALLFYFLASIGRAGWVWLFLNCHNRGDDCDGVQQSYVYQTAITILAVGSGMCYVRLVFARWWIWGSVGVVSVAIPALVVYNEISLIAWWRWLF